MKYDLNELKNRKGARNLEDVPPEIKELLNQGKISAVNLMESLSIENLKLFKNVFKEIGAEEYIGPVIKTLDNLGSKTNFKSSIAIGKILSNEIAKNNDTKILELLSNHGSDTVRSWATYIIGFNENLSISDKLRSIKPFAADEHFGVRETAWLSVRESIINNLEDSIAILSSWAEDENFNIRRFASESTRPRGVWTKHIKKLKESPELALAIIEPLKSDNEKYVQDSVGNWLNDASKSQGEWVIAICKKWLEESPTKQTKRITDRGLRTLNKGKTKKNK
ncbi:DNA alkylation repair protein [Methanobrevibacter curvatus]|uniref:DNA alkylation repair enzyme n=1 Tax=Methanobrevibacter curvatus TaxID=49547 RepID=A0A165ZI41_9EURY|nr:DNA alkylation repair protein [Methanobrevibacter curvatus]KZX10768.1 DNA alkylation repair enzyme [Methanobrevibacter curvatus]